jgi:protein-S-isoprenylcysteine O-methyltransferase Ste14
MHEGDRDGAAVRIPPPLVYLGGVVVGVLVHGFLLPVRLTLPTGARVSLTAVAILLGLSLMGGAIRLFRRSGQDPKPWEPTPEIISTGVYRFTRNPMYVGMGLLQIGIGVGLANGWILALVPIVLVLVYWTAIRHEEAYLERKFGEAYASYKRSVRRWL